MTTQARGPLGRFWLGSVSDELVRQAGMPILFVRPRGGEPELAPEPAVRRVLVLLDGSRLSELVLDPVLDFCDPGRTEYKLLQVVWPTAELNYGPAGGSVTGFQEALKHLRELEQRRLKGAHDYLEALAARLRARSFDVKTRVLADEQTANAILDDAAAHAADLIALATRGRGGLKWLVLGSVAEGSHGGRLRSARSGNHSYRSNQTRA